MSNISILYEDNHLLVVVKPPNLLSQGDSTGDPDLLTLMKGYIRDTYDKPGNVYLGLVHRLDRPVGGVMVFAKTSKAASRVGEQIKEGDFGRSYLAIVEGHPKDTKGSLRNYLLKDPKTNIVKVVKPGIAGAQEARLDYQVIDMTSSVSLVKIKLRTGRSHQIRVQMAELGHPLVGDQRYGRRGNQRQQIALWAEEVMFIHPTTKEPLKFSNKPPSVPPWTQFRRLF